MIDAAPDISNRIGVVTVTYNSALVLEDFFDSLAAQTYRNFILYVVDNASTDQTIELARQRTDLAPTIIANATNEGVAEGNNYGIRAALADKCELILLLNNDTAFPPDLIEHLYAGLDQYSCDMTTAKIYYYDRPNTIWCAGGVFSLSRACPTRHIGVGQLDRGQFNIPQRVMYAPTCCLLIRRRALDRVGMMDSRYFVYSDDADFLYRCMKAGLLLWYVPVATLWHKVSALTGSTSDFTLRYSTRNHIYFLRKHLPYWQARLLYWQSQLRSILAFMFGKISRSTWTLRSSAAAEGWKMLAEKAIYRENTRIL